MACGENPKRVYGTQQLVRRRHAMGNVAGYPPRLAVGGRIPRRACGGGRRPARIRRSARREPAARDARRRARRRDPGAQPLLSRRRDGDDDRHRQGVRLQDHLVPPRGRGLQDRDLLAENGICASMWADWWGFKLEAYDGIRENIALVDRGQRLRDRPLGRSERHPAAEPGSRQGAARGGARPA